MVLLLLLQAFWFVAPAYVANGFPPVVRGRKPLDFGKKLGKYRILGEGKTIEGTFLGVLAGLFIGYLQVSYQAFIPKELGLAEMTLPLVASLSLGAILGDLIGAFIKRRTGIKRGEPALLLDQLDFLVVAFLAASILHTLEIRIVLILLVLTPPIHWLTNYAAYRLGIKKTPW